VVPGLTVVSSAQFGWRFGSCDYPFALSRDEERTIDVVQQVHGQMLATKYLAGAHPALAGLLDGQVRAGSKGLFDGRLSVGVARRVIDAGRVRVVISDCLPGRADLPSVLAPLGFRARSYSCARVWSR
jgi:hypothetical protein